jgi:hypothetical protein
MGVVAPQNSIHAKTPESRAVPPVKVNYPAPL